MSADVPILRLRWLGCSNESGEVIPSWALMRISGFDADSGRLEVAKPREDGIGTDQYVANGPQSIAIGGTGACTFDWPAEVAYDSGDGVPANGETWGPGNGQWTLAKGNHGFWIGGTGVGVETAFVVPTSVLAASRARVEMSSLQASASGASVTTTHVYDVENYDTDDYWDAGSPTQVTIPADGLYLVVLNGRVDLGSGTNPTTWSLNVSDTIGRNVSAGAGTDFGSLGSGEAALCYLDYYTAGDVITSSWTHYGGDGSSVTDSHAALSVVRLTTAGGGAMSSFDITDGSTTQTIEGSDTITFAGGDGMTVEVSATDTVTYVVDLATDPGLEFSGGKLRALVDPAGALERVTAGLDVKNNGVDNARLAQAAAWTLKGRPATGTGDVSDFAISSLTEEATPGSGDKYLIMLSTGELRYVDNDNLPSAALDINGLTEDTAPDVSADFLATYDASAGGNKKVQLDNLAPPGAIYGFGGSTVPTGWLECDGSAVSRAVYANLFAAIGTAWGVGDGSTTFNLPDLQGRAPIGVGSGGGLTARSLADTGGAETHQLTESELAAHVHNKGIQIGAWGTTSGANVFSVGGAGGGNTGSTGGDTAHENMSPFAAVTFMIKY